MGGETMIYFDNSATTKPYKEVLDSFLKVSSNFFGNPSSLHQLGGQAERLLTKARQQIADLLHISAKEVFFTSGGTESNNLALKGVALMYKGRGRHVITTKVEHPSVSAAMEQLEQNGFEISYLPVDGCGRINVEDVQKAIRSDTILVSVIHVNNEVGTIQPIEAIGKMLKDHPKILFHVDHVQGIGKVPLDFKKGNVDLCSVSGHKFHGLKGTGILYIREGIKVSPLLSGGSQEGNLRSGTENVAGVVAMAKALRMVLMKFEKDSGRMVSIHTKLREGLEQMPGVEVNTPVENRAPHILNFSLPGINTEVFVRALGQQEIYVSTTSACSSKTKKPSPILQAMGVSEGRAESSVRISLSYENTESEAEEALLVIRKTIKSIGRGNVLT
jgi:cysteine desulfurase